MHLFPAPRPLEQRLGKAFFSAVPRCPGVYIMSGAARVLYIGQSGNLRARLGSYKNARPDRAPRKVIRLIHEVDSIVWERCGSPSAARLRESELLRLHRPKFNRIGTYPQARLFIWLSGDELGFELGRSLSPPPHAEVFGPFKGAIPAHSALVRVLWTVLRQPVSSAEYPAGLLTWRIPPHQRLLWKAGDPAFGTRVFSSTRDYLSGTSDELVTDIQSWLLNAGAGDACVRGLLGKDLEFLAEFYRGIQGGWVSTPAGGSNPGFTTRTG